ncbi:MAG: DUF2071 domain-containing protein [Anaerolineae bacterium]
MFPSASQILAETAHRPWSPPKRPWVMGQSWYQLLFAHWRVAPEAVAPLLPAPLELDTFDGSAWIGVVPFVMRNVHPRALYSLSPFPELNVRTYVRYAGKPGVWFLSLDAANRLVVGGARRAFHLPYVHAQMDCFTEGGWFQYRSQRDGSNARFEGCYRPVSPVFRAESGSLDEWLTERYCLYSVDPRGRLFRCEVHHRPWELQHAEAQITVNTMVEALPLPDELPILHYSEQMDVVTWYLERLDGARPRAL